MVTICRMSSMPFELTSSNRPMNGDTHQAPAFAASSAWVGEKHRA
jgi:hypothetical protein